MRVSARGSEKVKYSHIQLQRHHIQFLRKTTNNAYIVVETTILPHPVQKEKYVLLILVIALEALLASQGQQRITKYSHCLSFNNLFGMVSIFRYIAIHTL